MDAEADAELMMELIEYKRDVEGPEFDELLAEILAEADKNGYVHTQIIGRIFETGDLRRVNDLSSLSAGKRASRSTAPTDWLWRLRHVEAISSQQTATSDRRLANRDPPVPRSR